MKVTFESETEVEALRMLKANDMALCLWELVNNGWREFKHTDYDYQKAWDKINEVLLRYDIDVEKLGQDKF